MHRRLWIASFAGNKLKMTANTRASQRCRRTEHGKRTVSRFPCLGSWWSEDYMLLRCLQDERLPRNFGPGQECRLRLIRTYATAIKLQSAIERHNPSAYQSISVQQSHFTCSLILEASGGSRKVEVWRRLSRGTVGIAARSQTRRDISSRPGLISSRRILLAWEASGCLA